MMFCQQFGIRLSDKRLGRPKKNTDKKAEKIIAYQDNTDRIEVERTFSLAKRKFGLGLLLTKREDTTKSSIVLSVIAMNISRLAAMFLRFVFQLFNPYYFSVITREQVLRPSVVCYYWADTILDNQYDTIIIGYAQFMIGAHDNPNSANYKMFFFDY